ncbi:septal ring lytic transglycosylase RlpA family protein [Spongiibacter taiwanensis]|uniref:septal ring lytic transglycosylase RlpA family protein n=1 Tax=Spongiibacter taiwanensis TaxID=1748242 RepID=UPI002034CD2D|nr:septal ring lytic transglycosylase RlpA family protein [Spongiibacter taiwanensis]USA44135.1 septal ring lytic transglycosylase RlpA family protein [Spongiibacter taiwanensis]
MMVSRKFLLLISVALPLVLAACASTESVSGGALERGTASFYAQKYHGRQTASGEVFDQQAMTASHRTLQFGSKVRVTNLNNGRSVVVRINDRGPFVRGRIIDLSKAAFAEIADLRLGLVPVSVEVLH